MHWDRAQQRVCGGNPKLHFPCLCSTESSGEGSQVRGYCQELCGSWGSAELEGKITKSLKPLCTSCCLLARGLHNGMCFVSRGSKGDCHLCPAAAQQDLCALLARGPGGKTSYFYLIQELGSFFAACGFPALIPQEQGVGTLHLHSGYTALAN